jgi:hypothetical protein
LAQAEETRLSPELRNKSLAALSSWFESLDGFLAGTVPDDDPEAGHQAWEEFQPASRLPPSVPGASSMTSSDSALVDNTIAESALNELAMLVFGFSPHDDGLVRISHLPAFLAVSGTRIGTNLVNPLGGSAQSYGGADPLRVVLAFLSALNSKDREAFRLLAGIELDSVFKLLDFSGLQGKVQSSSATLSRASIAQPATVDRLEAERFLGSWRSSRLRSAGFQPGSPSGAVSSSEAGKLLAELLDMTYGSVIFNPGRAGERFVQDARRDLDEAWSAIGRAVAVDLRREAAPWLARRLGTSTVPSFLLEYTVQPAPSNAFKALMTIRAVAAGVSYGIPYQVAARALGSASAAYFDDAPVPVRYVEEPLPGLRIYIPRDQSDADRAIAELEADLAAAYPSALSVPSVLLAIPDSPGITHSDMCILLDGAYREAATGVKLARLFTALLHSRGYPELASRVVHEAEGRKD